MYNLYVWGIKEINNIEELLLWSNSQQLRELFKEYGVVLLS